MKQLITLMLLLAALTARAAYGNGEIDVNGTTRNYITYVPEGGCPQGRPLLISCHGMNQDAAYQKGMLNVDLVADTAKFITVFPNGINKGWDISGNSDVQFMEKIIDKMVSLYKIDRNRVYLSGFSMGGMFTYHCMNKMADKIAAFAPISGYPMGGATANADTRPIPIIHTHGTGDDVCTFDRVQACLDVWIQHNHCPSSAIVTNNYNGNPIITKRVWGPGDDNVEVVLIERAGKGHWVSNDGYPSVRDIWEFCKNYSLDKTGPTVRITSPRGGTRWMNIGGKAAGNDVRIDATAEARTGTIASVDISADGTRLATLTQAPYTCTWPDVAAGAHEITVAATDSEGKQTTTHSTFTVTFPARALNLGATFNAAGSLPIGWETWDGNDRRTGAMTGLGSGARILEMTGSPRDFDFALYTRNATGGAGNGYAAYASDPSTARLILQPGHYTVGYTIASWNQPDFGTVALDIADADSGESLLSRTDATTSNVGNTASNAFSGSKTIDDAFDVHTACRATIKFSTSDGGWADLLLAGFRLERTGADAIEAIREGATTATTDATAAATAAHNLAGQRVGKGYKGIVVSAGRKAVRR